MFNAIFFGIFLFIWSETSRQNLPIGRGEKSLDFWLPPQKRVANGEHVDCRHPMGQRQRDGQRRRQRHGQWDEQNDRLGRGQKTGEMLLGSGEDVLFSHKRHGEIVP